MIALVMLVALFALVLINVPIAVALGVIAATATIAKSGMDSMLGSAVVLFEGATKFPLIAIPLFVLAGAIMNTSGISRRLIAFASALLGFVRGGLSVVTIGTSLFFAEISGSAVADVAAIGSILIPAMERRGYPKNFAAAVTSSAASLAIIIPPSIPMILYAVMANTSVVQMFVAGVIPGLIGAAGPDRGLVLAGAPQRLSGRGGLSPGEPVAHLQGRGLGVPAADHHPGRNLRWPGDRDRGCRARRGGSPVHRRGDLSRTRPAPSV